MNREIRFRAFDKSDGRMLSVFEPEEQGKREYYPFVVAIGFSHWNKEDIILMQWTGLKDKKGIDIYEGDILREGNVARAVEFLNGSFGVINIHKEGKSFGSYQIDKGEVIGNIYETPELLTPPPPSMKEE